MATLSHDAESILRELENEKRLRKEAETLARDEREVADALDRTARALASQLDLDVIVQRATDEATKLSGAQFGAFFYNAPGDGSQPSCVLRALSGTARDAPSRFPPPESPEFFASTFPRAAALRIDDVSAAREGERAMRRGMPFAHLPLRSYLAVPVQSRPGETSGGLFFGHERAGVFDARAERLAGAIAAYAAIAIDNARLRRATLAQEEQQRLRAREALLAAEVGVALTRESDLDAVLQKSCESIVRNLGAAFARIWIADDAGEFLLLRASAGIYTHLDGPHGRVPIGKYKIGLIAEERKPHLTNDVLHDARVGDPEWARREGMVAFAGYPLIVGDHRVGVVAMFAKAPLGDTILTALASVSDSLAVAIERDHAERARRRSEQEFRTLVDSIPELAWTARADGFIDFYNQRWYEYTGTTFETMQGWGWRSVHDPALVDEVVERWKRTLATGELFEMEFPLRGSDGVFRWFLTRIRPLRDVTGQIVRWFGTNTNVDDQREARKRTEALLTEVAEQARSMEKALMQIRAEKEAAERRVADLEARLQHVAR